jgi:epoxide hydrolase
VDHDLILTNVTLCWLTGTARSSARLYCESARTWSQARPRSPVPAGVAVFPKEMSPSIRRLAERTDNIVHRAGFGCADHFAAMEAADLLIGDVREFSRRFR